MATLKNTTINDTGYLQLPVGTTAQRPSSPSSGYMRINSDTGYIELYQAGNGWVNLFPLSTIVATGGTVTTSGVYKTHTFTSSGIFTVTSAPVGAAVDIMVVAGGGGGGFDVGGGGGGGGLIYNPNYIGLSATSYSIVIGAGGAGASSGPGAASSGGGCAGPSAAGALRGHQVPHGALWPAGL